jgi:antitoxin component of MazEF toxin-antitoxin module
MATQIVRKGAAVTVEIPEELLKEADLAVGDQVEWTLTPSGALALRASGRALAAPEDYEPWKREEILAGFAELDAGADVAGDKVIEWLRSWGTAHELPPPQCD